MWVVAEFFLVDHWKVTKLLVSYQHVSYSIVYKQHQSEGVSAP